MRLVLDLPSHIVATAPNCVGAMLAGVMIFREASDPPSSPDIAFALSLDDTMS